MVEQTEPSDDVSSGKVIRTEPKAGTEMEPGQNEVVYVSTGPRTAAVPNVVGLSAEIAKKQLTDLGFTRVETEKVRSDRPEGEVVDQSVEKDTQLKLDEKIVLKVSKGGGETQSTEATEETKDENTTVSVRFSVPNRTEPYLLTILQDGAVVVEDAKVPAGVSEYIVTLTGKGTKEYDIYVDGEKFVTQKVAFNGN